MYLGEGQRWGPITYAQHGDDLFIINLFELMGIERPSYIDIGANHPFVISNTALLYSRGSRGVNIEANPDLLPEFHRLRPEDKNVNIGIAPEAGKLPFYMFEIGNGLNTFDTIERDQTIQSGNPVKETRMIDVITLNQSVDKYLDGKWPNLLSIDVEGLDYEILRTTKDIKSEIVCVETRRHAGAKMRSMMNAKGYWLASRLAENLIFVRSDKFAAGY